jgi:hypothetical protein
MPTLIVPPRQTPNTETMLQAAHAAGWSTQRLASWRVPPGLAGQDPVLYGEPLFADVVADALGVALLQPTPDWLPALPKRYRLCVISLSTLDEARGAAGPAFIKPVDDKCFPAQVYADGAALPAQGLLPGDTLALISEPVVWTVEYRCFVHERQVLTCSPYWREGALAQDEGGNWPVPAEERAEALAFAARLLADPGVALPPACVVDVGRIAGKGWAVVEANSAWGAGIYGCDPAAVLRVLRRAVLPARAVSAADQRWVRPLPEVEVQAEPKLPTPSADGLVTLYRPVGAAELALIAERGYTAFPPRLLEQPIFYPVLNEAYASQITREWNAQDGRFGYVTRFQVRTTFLERYPVQVVGNRGHAELWVPAEELAEFNANIVGPIEVSASYRPESNNGASAA